MVKQFSISRRNCLKNTMKGAAYVSFFSALPFIKGCQSSIQKQHSIRMGVSGRPQMLDPRKATDALSTRVNRLIYRSLIDFDQSFLPKPDLATWEQLSPTRYRFTLQDQSLFHDTQQPLQAEDVAATYRSVLEPSLGSAHRGSLLNIKQIKVLNNKQLEFILKEEDVLFTGRLVIGILPRRLIERNFPFHQTPVGSGPCRFISKSSQKVVLERLKDKVALEFLAVKDATVRVLKLRNRELDIIQNDLSPELVVYCQQQESLKVLWENGTNFGYIGFNFEDPLLAKPELRQAIAHGIDRQAVINAIFQGHARLANALLTPEHWSGAKDIASYEYNPDKSRALIEQVIQQCQQDKQTADLVQKQFDENGNPVNFLELSYKTSNDPTRIRLATIYQAQLKPLGIHLKIQSYDWGTFYNDIKQGRFQLYSLAWVGVKSPDIFQYVFHSNAIPPKGANRGRYVDAVADSLIDQAMQSQSIEKQSALYRQLQVRLQENLAAMPLWYENQYAVTASDIEGYQLFADGRYDGLLNAVKI